MKNFTVQFIAFLVTEKKMQNMRHEKNKNAH